MINARTTFPNISTEFVLRSAIAFPVSPEEVDELKVEMLEVYAYR
jgi:hypothetical protein